MIFIYDKKGLLIDEISREELISADDQQELNGQITSTISYPYLLHNESAMYFGYFYENEYFRYKIIESSKEKGVITIQGIHIFFDELKGNIIRDKRPTDVTALKAAQVALKGTDWTISSNVIGINSINFYFISSLEAFYKLLEVWDCEFKLELELGEEGLVKKNVHIENSISKDYGKWFEYGDKLLTVVAEENYSNIFTAYIGRGKGVELDTGGYGRKLLFDKVTWLKSNGDPLDKPYGIDYIEFKDLTSIYGYPNGKPKMAVVDFDDIEDAKELIKETYKYGLENSRPKLQLKADAISDNKVVIGELCSIIRPDLDIRYKTKVFKLQRNLLKGIQNFEFGDKIILSTSDRIKAEYQENKKNQTRILSVMQEALEKASKFYWGENGYNYDLKTNNEYGLSAGLYSFDKPIDQNPTKVIYVGAGKMLIANSKNPNGQWEWKTAATADGLIGDAIVSNSITANKLASDVGQFLDLSSNESIKLAVASSTKEYIDKNKDQLKGEPGKDGIDGARGPAGRDGIDGEPGRDGEPGKNGLPSYIHIAYADTIDGQGFSHTDSSKEYIGVLTNNSPNSPDTPSLYTWSKWQGKDGARGVQGPKGDDGKPSYVHFAYANDPDGEVDFSTTDSTDRKYIGTYTDFNIEDPEDPRLYNWTLVKGEKGEPGVAPTIVDGYWYIGKYNTQVKAVGKDGKDGENAPTTWIRYSNDKNIFSEVDQGQRYVGLYVGLEASDKASDYKWFDRTDLKPIEERVKKNEVEIAVNKENIESRVSEKTYNSDQVEINKKFNTITQDVNSVKIDINNIGGTNLIKGGKYPTNWIGFSGTNITETDNQLVNEWKTSKAIRVVSDQGDQTSKLKTYRSLMLSNTRKDLDGKLLTLSAYIKNNREYPISVQANAIEGEKTIQKNSIERVVITGFFDSKKGLQVQVYSHNPQYYVDFTIYQIMVEMGGAAHEWTSHPDEVLSGVTEVTDEGVAVRGQGADVESWMKSDGFYVYDAINGNPLLEANLDGVSAEQIIANDIFAPTIVKKVTEDTNLYIGEEATGDGSGRNTSNRADSLTTAFEKVLGGAKYIDEDVTINAYIKGSTNERIRIRGLIGQGYLNIIGETMDGGHKVYGGLVVVSTTIHVEVKNVVFIQTGPASLNDALGEAHKSSRVIFDGCTFIGHPKDKLVNGIWATGGSNVSALNCRFYDLRSAIYCDSHANAYMHNCSGDNINACGYVNGGSRMAITGTKPAHSYNYAVQVGGGFSYEASDTSKSSGTRPSYAPASWKRISKTFYPIKIGTHRPGQTYFWNTSTWIQGSYGGKSQVGEAWFGKQISNWLRANGGYTGTPTATIRAIRNKSSGGGSVGLMIGSPSYLKTPSVARGGTTSASLSSSLINAMVSTSPFTLRSTTTSKSNYAGFRSISITVTAMKLA